MYNLKLSIRNLFRQRTGTLINIVGLSLSLAVCLLIAMYVHHEYTFEKDNPNASHLYRLLNISDKKRDPIQPIAFFEPLKTTVPELKEGVMVQYYKDDFFIVNDEKIILEDVMFSTNEFFQLFNIKLLEGGNTPLDDARSAVISRSEAEKLFPHSQAVGKTIRYQNQYDFQIKGVFEDVPLTANYRPNVIMNIHAKSALSNYEYTSMNNASTVFYFLLQKNANITQIEDKVLAQAKISYNNDDYSGHFSFQSLNDIHLHSSDTLYDVIERSDAKAVQLFIIVAILVLLIATFNFINLSMALRNKRNFNTGMQKIMGASKKNIFGYLLVETTLLIGFCLLSALFIVWLVLPYFNHLMQTHITFHLFNPAIWIIILAIAIFNLLLPTLIQLQKQIHVKPLTTIKSKGKVLPDKNAVPVAQSFTIVQIAISICMIIGVITINKQFDLLLHKKLGFDKSNLVTIRNPWNENVTSRFVLYKQELEKMPEVSGVTGTWNPPGFNLNNGGKLEYQYDEEQKRIGCRQSPTDDNFFDVMQTQFLLGSTYTSSDSSKAVINQKCWKNMGVENPIGMKVKNLFDQKEYEICGVIEDIQNRSLQNESQAAIYYLYPKLSAFIIRLQPGNLQNSIRELEKVWNRIETGQPFRFSFVNDDLNANYAREIRMQKLLTIMSILAIFISMLGLYGLSIQTIERRTKEIGIRKVNGATILEILTMLNTNFIKWVLIAFIIATPIAYYAISRWLENFAYKTTLSWWIFALAGLSALVIALITISWQSWRAARRNPVEALRYE